MRVLVVGGGGREHAICSALASDPAVDRLFAAPGNAGIAEIATLASIPATDVEALADFAVDRGIDLTVVGPEAPLVSGLADRFGARGLAVFGPTRDGARIEGSKSWARALCDRHGIPAPRSWEFSEAPAAIAHLRTLEFPVVVKADGLAAGKGVTVAHDLDAATRAVEDALVRGVFGDAGALVLIEEYLTGEEVSAMSFVEGDVVVPMPLARDYKRAFDGDAGPNTGGMGAFSPVPGADGEVARAVDDILRATTRALVDDGVHYRGVLYAGLMVTGDGPRVLEFNCRFGDPETEAVLPRLRSGLSEALLACVEGGLEKVSLQWTPDPGVAVVLASRGYPGPVETGKPIGGLDHAARSAGVRVFHSGTSARDGRVWTSGGRVLTVSAVGPDFGEARRRAYEAASAIQFDGINYRGDIAVAAARGDA